MGKLGNISGKEAAQAFARAGWITMGQFLVLRNREIRPLAWLGHNQVTAQQGCPSMSS